MVKYFSDRAERTVVLTEDLQNLEKRVELYEKAYSKSVKKLQACLPGHGLDPEKRHVSKHDGSTDLPMASFFYCV